MAKVLHFPRQEDEFISIRDFLEDTIPRLEAEGAEGLLIAAKTKDGSVVTGYYNVDFGVRQELCGHIQCDIVDWMIRTNTERYKGVE